MSPSCAASSRAQGCLQLGQTENTAEHWSPGALPILVVSRGDHRMLLETQKGMGVLEASEMSSIVLNGLLPRSKDPPDTTSSVYEPTHLVLLAACPRAPAMQ